jgi:hypothetical protein
MTPLPFTTMLYNRKRGHYYPQLSEVIYRRKKTFYISIPAFETVDNEE